MPILHSVFFYFKEDVSMDVIQGQKEFILDELSKIEHIWDIRAGAPAGVIRDVVDNDYGMSLHFITHNLDTLSSYQQHRLHLQFIELFKKYWKIIKVFDTEI